MARKNINKKQTKLKFNVKLVTKYLTHGMVLFVGPLLTKILLTESQKLGLPLGATDEDVQENVNKIVKTVERMIQIAIFHELKKFHENEANRE